MLVLLFMPTRINGRKKKSLFASIAVYTLHLENEDKEIFLIFMRIKKRCAENGNKTEVED